MEPLRVLAIALVVLSQQVNCGTFQYSQAVSLPAGQFYVYSTPMVAQPVAQGDKTPGLPCLSGGFFTHPTNCSRFYRCVDYVGTGTVFSTYEFVCPAGTSFVTQGKDTCVPGDCPAGGVGSGAIPQPQVAPAAPPAVTYPAEVTQASPQTPPAVTYPAEVTPAVQPSVQPAVTYPPDVVPQPGAATVGSQPTSGASDAYQPPAGTAGTQPWSVEAQPAATQPEQTGQGSVQPGVAYPQPGGVASAAGDDSSAVVASEGTPQVEEEPSSCPSSYIQDAEYCNIYLPCPDDGRRFLCTSGSVFNQQGQLCDLYNIDSLCVGKQFYEESTARSNLVFVGAPQYRQQVHVPSIGGFLSPLVYSQPRGYSSLGNPFQPYYNRPVQWV